MFQHIQNDDQRTGLNSAQVDQSHEHDQAVRIVKPRALIHWPVDFEQQVATPAGSNIADQDNEVDEFYDAENHPVSYPPVTAIVTACDKDGNISPKSVERLTL